MKNTPLMAALALSLALPPFASAAEPQAAYQTFFANLGDLCGRKFEGRVVSNDAADADFAGRRLVMHVRDCSPEEIRIPFSVGEDRSRTWVVTRGDVNLRLKHDHRHADGTTDVLHWYGGETTDVGQVGRQTFPVDAESIALFNANGAAVSTTNIWALDLRPGQVFAYELSRVNRHFRVEFDLTKPVDE
jgi:hypothetical protein